LGGKAIDLCSELLYVVSRELNGPMQADLSVRRLRVHNEWWEAGRETAKPFQAAA